MDMKYCLIRHGKDDETVRGGWSNSSLTSEGITQVKKLAAEILSSTQIDPGYIFSSDLQRAKKTAEIISRSLDVPVVYRLEFREVNNGDLTGMNNSIAREKYPGLFWNLLNWE